MESTNGKRGRFCLIFLIPLSSNYSSLLHTDNGAASYLPFQDRGQDLWQFF